MDTLHNLIEDNGDIWAGTHDDGLFLFSNGEFRSIEIDMNAAITDPKKKAQISVYLQSGQ